MEAVSISQADMERCVARFGSLKGSDLAFLDQRMPGYQRELINILGMNVTENVADPRLAPKIGTAHGFSVAMARADPGNGACLHWHETEEFFMPLVGRWSIYWLDGDVQREVILDPFDSVNVPTHIYRGFRNVGTIPGTLFAVVGGPDPGKPHWHPSVIEAARATGLSVDDAGNLIVSR
jgi:mannose-6-phosphate isomerase-like protein (cupin superfamily)